jgi:Ser/Thr protein kinase RdoA (MazF antagonist)
LIVMAIDGLTTVLRCWSTILGDRPVLGAEDTGRELWPVTAEDGNQYFLKRVSPWRNLPLADEARVLRWLNDHDIDVAEYLITDQAAEAGRVADDSFVLMPCLPADELDAAETLAMEATIGRAVAHLHRSLGMYPWSANSYQEELSRSVLGELLVPDDVATSFEERKGDIAARLRALPVQLVHGDLTPSNVLLRRPAAVAGFIDFDHLPLAPRVWDIAKYQSRRLRLHGRTGRDTVARTAHIEPFLRGYQDVNPLTAAELEVLSDTILAANILEASYAQEVASGRLQRRMLADHERSLADTVEAARWQLAHSEDVAAAVAGVSA